MRKLITMVVVLSAVVLADTSSATLSKSRHHPASKSRRHPVLAYAPAEVQDPQTWTIACGVGWLYGIVTPPSRVEVTPPSRASLRPRRGSGSTNLDNRLRRWLAVRHRWVHWAVLWDGRRPHIPRRSDRRCRWRSRNHVWDRHGQRHRVGWRSRCGQGLWRQPTDEAPLCRRPAATE